MEIKTHTDSYDSESPALSSTSDVDANLTNNPSAESNKIDASSAAPTITSTTATSPTSATTTATTTAPEPPRWRFVNEAKKSLGYSSIHAGSYIKGQSSDELGAKYTAPDISLYKPAKEEIIPFKGFTNDGSSTNVGKDDNAEVGKLNGVASSRNTFTKENNTVGKLQIRQASPDDFMALPTGSFGGLPKGEAPLNETRSPFKQWTTSVQVGHKTGREHEWYDGKVHDSYTMPGNDTPSRVQSSVGKIGFHRPGEDTNVFVGEVPKKDDNIAIPNVGGNGSDNSSYDDPREGALFIHRSDNDSDGTNPDGNGSFNTALTESPADDTSDKRKRRCLYLLLLLLLLLVIILGVLLGKKNEEKGVVAATAIAGGSGVLIPPIVAVNETSTAPSLSLSPSAAPTYMQKECPAGTKLFSIKHKVPSSEQLTTSASKSIITWKIKDTCSGEVVSECMPCPVAEDGGGPEVSVSKKRQRLPKQRSNKEDGAATNSEKSDVDPVLQSRNHNNPTLRHLIEDETLVQIIEECLPFNNEYTMDFSSVEDPSCCGFDPSKSVVVSYDNVIIKDGAASSAHSPGLFDDEPLSNSIYFGERDAPCMTDLLSLSPTTQGSDRPSLSSSEKPSLSPSLSPSRSPSFEPSDRPSSHPTDYPSTSSPTQSPVVFLGGCPETFVPFSYYNIGTRVESKGIVYECISYSCGSFGYEPYGGTSSLWRQGWSIVGSCYGSMSPTSKPTNVPTPRPTNNPTPSPSRQPTTQPTVTCSTETDFNLCLAVDMSGSVCNDATGDECLNCASRASVLATFLPFLVTNECRDTYLDDDTCCSNFASVKEFSMLMVNLLGDFPAEKSFSVVQFATSASLVSNLSSAEQTQPILGRLDYTGGLTNHAAAIQMCQRTLVPSFGSERKKNFIMLITDGVPSEPIFDPEGAAELTATRAKSDGTIIIPVFISPFNDWTARAFMRRLSSDGKVFDVTDFDSLNSLQERLVEQVSCS